jgi:AraC family transcriptional regulator
MNDQPKSYAEWKSNAQMGLMEDPADNEVAIIQINTPAMPGPMVAPVNQEEFIHWVQHWNPQVIFRYQHEENAHWSDHALRVGQLMLFPRLYHVVAAAESPLQVISVALKRAVLAPLLNEYFPGDPESLKLCLRLGFEDLHIHCLMRELQRAYADEDHLALDCLGQTLGLHLFLNYSRARAMRTPGQYRLSPWQRHQLDAYIHTHLDQKISLEHLANALGISRAHLTRTVRQSTGLAPHQYVLHKRTEQAQQFLRLGRHSIAEVASLTGFTDQSHLNRTFRQAYGCAPSQLLHRAS